MVVINRDHYFTLFDEEQNKALVAMKLLLKDESRWPCAFNPLTFNAAKLEEFVDVAVNIGKIHTSFTWYIRMTQETNMKKSSYCRILQS